MTRPTLPLRALSFVLAAGATCWSAAAFAQAAPAPTPPAPAASGDTIRATDAERDAVLNSRAYEDEALAQGRLPDSGGRGARAIHGEVGAMIGSHGTRGVYGVAEVPLGDSTRLTVAAESTRYGYGSKR